MTTVVLFLLVNLIVAGVTTILLGKVERRFDWILRCVNILTYVWVLVVLFGLSVYGTTGEGVVINWAFMGWATIILPLVNLAITVLLSLPGRPPGFESYSFSHAGWRDHNEDVVLECPERGLFAAIDGVGGHAYGEVAAEILRAELDATCVGTPRQEKLVKAFVAANAKMLNEAKQRKVADMMCVATVVWAWREGDELHVCVGHVGDTRGYAFFPKGDFVQFTKDHSSIPGGLSELEQMKHPRRNLLTKSLGAEPLDPKNTKPWGDFFTVKYPLDTLFLLVTDGVSDGVMSGELANVVCGYSRRGLRVLVQKIFAAAYMGQPRFGKKDNIGIVAARWV